MNDEWLLVAAVCVAPVLLFGAFEVYMFLRHKRQISIARRPKDDSRRAG